MPNLVLKKVAKKKKKSEAFWEMKTIKFTLSKVFFKLDTRVDKTLEKWLLF